MLTYVLTNSVQVVLRRFKVKPNSVIQKDISTAAKRREATHPKECTKPAADLALSQPGAFLLLTGSILSAKKQASPPPSLHSSDCILASTEVPSIPSFKKSKGRS